jgi:hypothetical protein
MKTYELMLPLDAQLGRSPDLAASGAVGGRPSARAPPGGQHRVEVAGRLQLLRPAIPAPRGPEGCILLWLGPSDVPEHERLFEDLTLAMMPATTSGAVTPLCTALQEGSGATGLETAGGIGQAVAKTLAKRFKVQAFVSVDPRLAQVLHGQGHAVGEGDGEGALLVPLLRALIQVLDSLRTKTGIIVR